MIHMAPSQRGISLVTAIFVLVVLGALGGYMVSISGSQHYTSLHALQGAKAYHAARSGMEWAMASLDDSGCFADASLSIDDFVVNVTCTPGGLAGVYRVRVLSETGSLGQANYAARQLEATISLATP